MENGSTPPAKHQKTESRPPACAEATNQRETRCPPHPIKQSGVFRFVWLSLAGTRPGRSPSIDGAHQAEQRRARLWTPAFAGATNQRTHALSRSNLVTAMPQMNTGNGEAEPAHPSPSAPPSAGRARRELSRRCLSPQGEFRRDPPDATEATELAQQAVRQGAFLW